MPFKIAVIGAGWYGCHISSSLASLGFKVMVFDRAQRPLHEASGNNQFRLHLGFHYARHQGTRQQSRDGFLRFIERYPTLSAPIEENIYAVPHGDSLIDFQTYKLIMASSGIDFVELKSSPHIHDVEGALSTSERVLLISRARNYFMERLGSALILDTPVTSIVQHQDHVEVEGIKFDYLIDASWGQVRTMPLDIFYEPTMLLYYEAKEKFPAITFVDGPLCSVYPTEDPSIFTLSSVPHTPLGSFSDAREARGALTSVTNDLIGQKRRLMEEQIAKNVPQFRDVFSFAGVQLSMKTKPVGRSDDRSCYVYQDNRIISVMSGKIDTVFFATERILSMLEAQNSQGAIPVENTIRGDIVTAGRVAEWQVK
ncbi:FAD-dependent oxidoreductase [Neorhizobium alkalisoli]|uniref:Glycine/D-amino acid oxidase-like deaminating enzyme n=1 Tax=Neorhizobium alkalisoli TaxID=528178 RepID=A0A561R3I7_9HYPH|nr:FAD-dependent oxidoreductase [Neorhizobium alkalisoli]TWF57159.1 glycine/D-amino acid oxidase-like deaminating enzyme [Neorhizobium alkalisoli]